MRRVVLSVALALAGCLPAAASAAPRTVASVPEAVPIGAYGGWVVWSEPSADHKTWTLTAWHGGLVAPLAAKPRSKAFDLDLGTDGQGRVVATFSRCRREVAPPGDFLGGAHRGCRVQVLDLASGRERSARIPRPTGASDTMPSMWHGRIAFARTRPRSHIDQVLLWDPARRKLRRLNRGPLAKECYQDATGVHCRSANYVQVSALDLGARVAAFRLNISGPQFGGHASSQLRATTLAGRNVLLSEGWVFEACDESDSVTTYSLGRPTVDGGAVWFGTVAERCERAKPELHRARLRPFGVRRARIPGNQLKAGITQVVLSGRRLYALIARQVSEDHDGACPCLLKSLDIPPLRQRSG